MNTLGYVYDAAQYAEATKVIKEQVKIINSALQGKEYLVGERITIADITVFTSLIIAFAFVLDGGFRKAMPNVSAWF
jgi:elongation factor 1-gamma